MFIFLTSLKTARLIQSYNKNVSSKRQFLDFFKALPHILSLCKLGNDQSYEFKGLEDYKLRK